MLHTEIPQQHVPFKITSLACRSAPLFLKQLAPVSEATPVAEDDAEDDGSHTHDAVMILSHPIVCWRACHGPVTDTELLSVSGRSTEYTFTR